MKRLFVQNIDASDVVSDQIVMPSDDDIAIASLLNAEGKNSVEAWFMGEERMFNGTMTQVRNAAVARDVGQYTRSLAGGPATPTHEIIPVGTGHALQTARYYYNFNRQGSTDWTLAAVLQLGDLSAGTNTSLFGWQPGGTGENLPSMNLTDDGTIRAWRYANQQTPTIFIAGAVPNIRTQPYLILISQSRTRGAVCRVNGVTVYTNSFSNGLAPSTGTAVAWLGSDVSSASFNGIVFSAILCNEDVTPDPYKLATIEGGLMRKYGLA